MHRMSQKNDFFQNCRQYFEAQGFHSSVMTTVLESITVGNFDNNTLTLYCNDSTYYETLLKQKMVVSLFEKAAAVTWKREDIKVHMEYRDQDTPKPQGFFDAEDSGDIILAPIEEAENSDEPDSEQVVSRASVANNGNHSLIPNLTFETFIRGQSNQMACAACEAAARNPGQLNNPVFIYGPTGLGKTHLLHSVGNAILKEHPSWNILYVTSGDFLKDLVDSIRMQRSSDFQKKYRDCDVLLVDDIQFLEKKEATQLEFFHTFNYLYSRQKQIVITSDKYPKDIPNIEERLKSRFLQGLIADIEPPSYEDRIAIIQAKMKEIGLNLPDEGIYLIASQVSGNVRELQGVLNTLVMESNMTSKVPSRDSISALLRRMIPSDEPTVNIPDIQKTVTRHYGISVSDLLGRSRSQKVTMPRQVAMYLSRELTGHSTTEIAEAFQRKDHTTVMHAISKIKELVYKDSSIRLAIKEIRASLEKN